MSSSSPATDSRSPSPLTPEPSDALHPVAVQGDDLPVPSSWYLAMHPSHWTDQSSCDSPHKVEDNQMLRLDDLLEQHAYEDIPNLLRIPQNLPQLSQADPSLSNFGQNSLPVPSVSAPVTLTKPIPPPASLPRKQDPSTMNHRVVHPPKEACFNLPIMFPSIPEGGTKSRVETQVRVTVDLADISSSSDPYKYDRIGSWKWLKLPPGTATKKRTRKQGKIDPDPQDILHLSAYITCASPPHNRVLSCSSCQAREAKRVAKKLAARVRPARSDSESGDGDPSRPKNKQHEDTTSIIQFNCAEILDFSTGSVVLPLRITCYCRHHREKVGFNVHFTMSDSMGRVVGAGTSRPIMITDDHKTAVSNKHLDHSPANAFTSMESDWSQMNGIVQNDTSLTPSAPSKRRKDTVPAVAVKKRPKPYDSIAKPTRPSREGSVSSIPSPSTTHSPLPKTRSPTPISMLHNLFAQEAAATTAISPSGPSQPPALVQPSLSLNSSESSSPDTLATPSDNSDILMPDAISQQHQQMSIHINANSMVMPSMPVPQQTMPYMFFGSPTTSQNLSVQLPTIHRLIPNMGPTHGGIEVTVLGANFHSSLQLNCIFGNVAASSTQRWSENTLVCVLPPRATAGVVAVWFDGFPKMDEQVGSPPSLFTYMDESDRALMELALQVVGLKMTGKIEDAKNVAMRIVGTAGSDNSQSHNGNISGMMHMTSSSSAMRNIMPLLAGRGVDSEDFESLVIDFLTILDTPLEDDAPDAISTVDAISHTSSTGQTLLHLAAFLRFSSLTQFLVRHGADLDARDRGGYTPLHFAALSSSTECSKILIDGGADREIVNAQGKTAQEIAPEAFFSDVLSVAEEFESSDEVTDDEEADWGDAEEDSDTELRRIALRRSSLRALRRGLASSGRGTPRRSVDVSRTPTPPPPGPSETLEKPGEKQVPDVTVDAKQAASFFEMIQRTFSQLPAPQGIIPNMPQLPQLPKHLPNLPDLPAVPWGALPQLPVVFPVFVPMMPGWPSLFGGEHSGSENKGEEDAARGNGAQTVRAAAQEWRATWEKWVAIAVATTARQQTEGEDMPPPVAEAVHSSVRPLAGPSTPSEMRPVGYGGPVPEQEVDAFVYQPPAKQRQRKKKHDRMLLLFWLPILLLSMLWAFHNGVRFMFAGVKAALPAIRQ
ncbi:hypothetical protein BDQ17DRAFT_1346462 [Cyathus striatus]|nr:hypothetical protein BDQ17DRAFT_1346462 [Cyathus striatus]